MPPPAPASQQVVLNTIKVPRNMSRIALPVHNKQFLYINATQGPAYVTPGPQKNYACSPGRKKSPIACSPIHRRADIFAGCEPEVKPTQPAVQQDAKVPTEHIHHSEAAKGMFLFLPVWLIPMKKMRQNLLKQYALYP